MTDEREPAAESTAGEDLPTAPQPIWAPPPTSDWRFGPEAPTSAFGLADAVPTAPATGNHSSRRRVGLLALGAVALVAVGAAGGAGISRALTDSSGSSASAGAPNGSSGGTPTLPGGSNGFGYGGSGSEGFGGSNGFPNFPGFPGFSSGGSSGSNGSNTSDGPTDAASIARDVDPGVVDITTTVAGGEAAGTGMVLTSNGEVLTNNHVINGARSISVRDVGNGKTYKATVVGYDRSHDVAVLQLTGASGLTTVKTATSEPSSGAAVVGIGNAGGTGGTPSYAGGAITQTNASITASDEYDGTSEKLTGLLATDANIQAGDSGGPLVNTSGEVVGMDTAASSGFSFDTGGGSGSSRGFAIPITTALQIAAQIEAGDGSSTVHIGATAQLGVYVGSDASTAGGAQVVQTVSGGPAAQAGISSGDVITSVAGHSVQSASGLTALMTTLTPGSTVTVDYTTGSGANRSTQVTLGSGPPQ